MSKSETAGEKMALRKEKRKLLKVLILLSKVYRKSARTKEQKSAYEEVAESLKKLRKAV